MFSFRGSILLLLLTIVGCQITRDIKDNHNINATNSVSISDFLKADEIPTRVENIDDFIKNGRQLVKKQVGDLNSDAREDAVLIVLQPVNQSSANNSARPHSDINSELLFLIILQTADGEFQLDAVSKKLLFQYSDISKASMTNITITNGEISIEQTAVAQATLTYKNTLKKTAQGWSVISGKLLSEMPTQPDKKGFIKIDVFEQSQKKQKLLKDFDIENLDLTAPKLIRTY